MAKTQQVLKHLDQLIKSHSVLQHPFYQAWSAGQLTHEDLAVYSWVYYPHVEAFPRYIEEALKQTDDPFVRDILEENLREELGDPIPHPEYWLYFAQGMGVDRQEVLDAMPVPEVDKAIGIFIETCKRDPASALSALYSYESQQPEICTQKIQGLREYYQVHSPQTLVYFTVHEAADVQHREEAREALAHCLEQGVSSETIFDAAQRALDAHWLLLDGVSRQAGLSC